MARLRTSQGHILNLPVRRINIGESPANEIPVASGLGLAPVHFRLQPWESGYFLEDAGSGLGTLVNGNPVSWVPLKHGDIITAGELRMTYESEAPAPFPASSESASPVPTATPDEPDQPAPGPPPASPPPESPPAWLPAAALQPPVPPWARPLPISSRPSSKGTAFLAFFLLLLAAATAGWFYYKSR